MNFFMRWVSAVLMIACALFLFGWDELGWSFVDPFLTTLLLIGSPFLLVMGFVRGERLEEVPNLTPILG